MSTFSNCVTCGMVCHAATMCSAVLRRMPRIALRSIAPNWLKSGSGSKANPPPAGAPAGPATLPVITFLA